MVETRRAAVGMLVDEKRRFEADAVDVFDDVLGDSLLAAAMTPVRTPIRRTQSEPVQERLVLVPALAPDAGGAARDAARRRLGQGPGGSTTRSRRLKSAQRGAEKVEQAASIARRHLDDARRAHAQAQGDVDDAVGDLPAPRRRSCASSWRASTTSVARRSRTRPPRRRRSPPSPSASAPRAVAGRDDAAASRRMAEVEGRASCLSLDEAQFYVCRCFDGLLLLTPTVLHRASPQAGD